MTKKLIVDALSAFLRINLFSTTFFRERTFLGILFVLKLIGRLVLILGIAEFLLVAVVVVGVLVLAVVTEMRGYVGRCILGR